MIGNELLRKKSTPFDCSRESPAALVADVRDTLLSLQEEKKTGRALAAPQIGVLSQLIYMHTTEREIVMINPVITGKSEEMFEVWDSCFSADAAFFGNTLRHREIEVKYLDAECKKVKEVFRDDMSELFQHEIDHLQGILFTDRIIDNQIIMRSEWERLYNDN